VIITPLRQGIQFGGTLFVNIIKEGAIDEQLPFLVLK
jgi:hypothetical protein